jgi:hypothetical protein
MAINITTLFTRLGRAGKLALLVNQHQAALPAAMEALITQYDGQTPPGLRDVVAQVIAYAGNGGIVSNQQAWMSVVQQAMQQTVIRTVRADKPTAAGSLGEALAEVVRQMAAGSQTVARSTTTATAAAGTNQGNGVCVISPKRGDGLLNELVLPEVVRLECTADSFGGGRAAGQEGFTYFGQVGNPADVWGYDWPQGSGVATAFTAVSPATDLLTNGDMEAYTTANVPDSWAVESGTPGTHLLQDTGVFYDALSSLKLPGSATLAGISQSPNASLTGQTPYAVVLWVRTSGVPAAGVLTVDLTDASGTVTQDAQVANNSFTQSLPALAAATWTPISGVFRTPKAIPSGLKLRVRLTTALSTGTSLNVDRVMLAPLAAPYAGGPGLAVLSGAAPFAASDMFTLTMTNDRASASYNATWQALFDRAFGMRALGLQLPSTSGSPTQADTLITS